MFGQAKWFATAGGGRVCLRAWSRADPLSDLFVDHLYMSAYEGSSSAAAAVHEQKRTEFIGKPLEHWEVL